MHELLGADLVNGEPLNDFSANPPPEPRRIDHGEQFVSISKSLAGFYYWYDRIAEAYSIQRCLQIKMHQKSTGVGNYSKVLRAQPDKCIY